MTDWWQAADAELLAALGELQTALNTTWAQMLEVVREVESRGLAERHGYVTGADLLRGTQNISRSTAKARVRAAQDVLPARSLSGEPQPAEMPATAAAVAEGAISAEHVRAIQVTLAALPPHLERHRASLEADLAGFARTLDPDAVLKLGKRALAALDPDGPRPRDGDPTRTRFALVPRGAGFETRGWLDREAAAVLRTALSPLAAPAPAAEGVPDPRSLPERQGDALVELARRVLDTGRLPAEGGQPPHVTVTVALEVLERRLGAGLLGFGEGILAAAISAEDARRWACDAHLVPIVLGAEGAPLDIGRRSRVVSRSLRRALAHRDGGCSFPGCECPPQWTEAHHVVHWAEGGATALHNLLLLCPRHHTLIHAGEWEVSISQGFPLFHPPPWIPGGPRRNPLHRIDLIART
ncbi:HNH endonuclease signature motif containing protein [Pseudonocardia sp. H11422]|uniref:HNH endonuclease signature motif containing protein n=1 Tax=Pseudonocardia sp. H11422 TaxID=2835866 RepID=UPI001BDC4746|nr:HNH endonuclease signature motif containing protein [Pseudonocardia sp. H11422]